MFKNEKGIAQLFLLLFLVAAIGIGLYLSQNTQIFRPKAAGPQDYKTECKLKVDDIKYEEPCSLAAPRFENGKWVTSGDPKGYKYATIKCADGYEVRIGDDSRCVASSAIELTAPRFCQNHSQCTFLNKSDPLTSLIITPLSGNSYVRLSFDPIAGSDPVAVVHTAVWPGFSDEKRAKSSGLPNDAVYQGSVKAFSRVVSVPSYLEYYSVDTKEHSEELNKRVISASPRSIMVTKVLTDENGNGVDIKNTSLQGTPVQLGGESGNDTTTKFSYLAPGDYKLKYFIPAGFTVRAVHSCDKNGTCTQLPGDDANKHSEVYRYAIANVSAPFNEGETNDVKIEYIIGNNRVATPTPTVQKPVILCDVANSKATLKSIPGNPENIDLRVDNTVSGGWDGKCSTSAPDDFCKEKLAVSTLSSNGFTFDIKANQKYNLFYVANTGSNKENSKTYSFTCKSPVAECLSSNSVRISFAPIAGAVKYTVRLDNTNNPWKGRDNNIGDTTDDMGTTSKIYGISSAPNAPYTFWYHAVDSSGKLSAPIYGSFVCPANAEGNSETLPEVEEQ